MNTRVSRFLVATVVFGIVCVGRPYVGMANSIPITGGDVVLTPAPPSLQHNELESDDQIFLVEEQSSFSLPSILSVDVDGTPGLYEEASGLTGGTLPAGTIVDSFVLHFDPVGSPRQAVSVSGSVTFGQPIVGLLLTRSNLDLSDGLGAPGTAYGGSFRGFELSPGSTVGDDVIISPDRHTISVNFGATTFYDDLRVLTSVPEPSSAMLAVVVFMAGLFLSRDHSLRKSWPRTTS